ncbi:flagellar assembly peptidoglycan hydrolase FlgJ [Shewanella litorisediminis]|uniref:Peptidoglycan hydrolase FlgJ n=1 Tax=Shewanella litorisediminis TaxID=1173586 RepID=A0ABX7G030_9GAMM|nr:flagellar assembly peptidoglycan hydrolase FlgJ [Shewanella litorisediminis]MCL2919693.1 flagellar assembly peptidoglycan hydrolase FlgJ [Shewanella litorisediminis]QRH00577.1 flagellar assembly peptidoglycan hydrolase FlgJ [Shewanella litorisediminis]
MEKLSNASHFLDIGGLDKLRAQAKADDKAALREVAKQFEGIFVQMLMKSMRDANAVFESDSPFNSQYTKFYEEMRDQQMAVDMSQKGMLGLVDLMVQQLSPQDSPITPSSVLGGDKRFDMGEAPMMLRRDGASDAKEPNVGLKATAAQALAQSQIAGLPGGVFTGSGFHEAPVLDAPTAVSAPASSAAAPIFDQLLAGKQTPSKQLESERDNPNFESRQDFIRALMPLANEAAKRLGTKPEVLIAQSALETGWGQKLVRRPDGSMSNNLFNIKADKRWEGEKAAVNTLEFEQGVAVRQRADFRVYDTLEQSFNDFVDFLKSGERYGDALKQAARPASFVQGLQNAGYATDPQYADKVMRVMQAVTSEIKAMALGN